MSKKSRRRQNAARNKRKTTTLDQNKQATSISEFIRLISYTLIGLYSAARVANARTIIAYFDTGSSLGSIAYLVFALFALGWFVIGTSLLASAILIVRTLILEMNLPANRLSSFSKNLQPILHWAKFIRIVSGLLIGLGILTLLTTTGFQSNLEAILTRFLPLVTTWVHVISKTVLLLLSWLLSKLPDIMLNILANLVYDWRVKPRFNRRK